MKAFKRRHLRTVMAAALSLGVVAAAMSASSGASTTAGSSGGSAGLGKKNPAKGQPIKVGFIGDGQSSAIDNRDELAAAKAGAKYVNQYLKGIGGRPIELTTCATRQDPAVATDCGNQMVEDGVAAVLSGVSGQSLSFFQPVKAAGIPFMQHTSGDQDILLDTASSFALTNPLAGALGHPVLVTKDSGFKRAAVVVIDVPTATGLFNALGGPIFKKNGATLDVVAVAPGTADMTPQVQAALQNDPQLIQVIGDSTFCLSAFQALNQLQYDGVVTTISNCVNDEVIKTLPKGALKGVQMSAFIPLGDKKDASWNVYVAAMKKFAAGVDPDDSTTADGFATVVSFAESMAGTTGDLSPASVIATIKAMPQSELAVGGGVTFQCNGQQSSLIPAVCGTEGLETTLRANGRPGAWKVFDPSDVLKLG